MLCSLAAYPFPRPSALCWALCLLRHHPSLNTPRITVIVCPSESCGVGNYPAFDTPQQPPPAPQAPEGSGARHGGKAQWPSAQSIVGRGRRGRWRSALWEWWWPWAGRTGERRPLREGGVSRTGAGTRRGRGSAERQPAEGERGPAGPRRRPPGEGWCACAVRRGGRGPEAPPPRLPWQRRRPRGAAEPERAGSRRAPAPARPPMPRKALLCVLQLDVRSVSARAADPAVLSSGRGGPQAGGEAAVCSSGAASRLASPPPPLCRRPALPARGFFWEAGPGPAVQRAAALRVEPQLRLAPGQLLPLRCVHSAAAGPCAPLLVSAAAVLLQSSHCPVEKVFYFKSPWVLGSCMVWEKHSWKSRAKNIPGDGSLYPCEGWGPCEGTALSPARGSSGVPWVLCGRVRSAGVKVESVYINHVRTVPCALCKIFCLYTIWE